MNTWRTALTDQRGVALPLALILLIVLTMMAVTMLSLGAVEPRIASNLSDTARARQLAEAGIEWAYQFIATADWNTLLAGPDNVQNTADDQVSTNVATVNSAAILTNAVPLPGLTSAQGTFSVTIRNDNIGATGSYPGDQVLTGIPVDGGGKFNDTNGTVIVTATGTFNGATRRITAAMRRAWLDPPGALNLPGMQADTFTNAPPSSGAYSIDGRDWRRADTTSPTGLGPLKFGLAVQPGVQSNVGQTYEQVAQNGFNTAAKQAYVQGKHQSTGALTTGLDTIAPDSSLTPAVMQTFLNHIASHPATTIIQSTQPCPVVLTGNAGNPTNPGMSNGCGASGALNLGTPSNPALVYVRGDYDPSSLFNALRVSGPVQGAGILIVEDGDFQVTGGSFKWDGVVIVTGRYVGAGFRSGSNAEIRGAMIANETVPGEAGGFFEFLNQANSLRIRYSKENIETALRQAYNTRITAWREN